MGGYGSHVDASIAICAGYLAGVPPLPCKHTCWARGAGGCRVPLPSREACGLQHAAWLNRCTRAYLFWPRMARCAGLEGQSCSPCPMLVHVNMPSLAPLACQATATAVGRCCTRPPWTTPPPTSRWAAGAAAMLCTYQRLCRRGVHLLPKVAAAMLCTCQRVPSTNAHSGRTPVGT